jgi:hypothetical protein
MLCCLLDVVCLNIFTLSDCFLWLTLFLLPKSPSWTLLMFYLFTGVNLNPTGLKISKSFPSCSINAYNCEYFNILNCIPQFLCVLYIKPCPTYVSGPKQIFFLVLFMFLIIFFSFSFISISTHVCLSLFINFDTNRNYYCWHYKCTYVFYTLKLLLWWKGQEDRVRMLGS